MTDHHDPWREEAAPHGRTTAYFANLTVSELACGCATETSKFLKQAAHDERFGLELFRRAIGGRCDDAWACLYGQYAPLVLTWVTQHPHAAPIVSQEGADPLVNAAFAKFSLAVTPAKMEHFDCLAALLKYLKLCVHSVVADEVRARQSRQVEEPLEVTEHDGETGDPAEDVVSRLAAEGVWRAIQEQLNGEDEHVLVHCTYVLGMKPAEISTDHPRLFPTAEDVYRVKRNVLERLRRNRRLQMYFAERRPSNGHLNGRSGAA